MLNIKRHVKVSGPLQRSENHSVYSRRAEATRAGKSPLWPSLDFSSLALQNRVSHRPPTSERRAPKAEGRVSVSSLRAKAPSRPPSKARYPTMRRNWRAASTKPDPTHRSVYSAFPKVCRVDSLSSHCKCNTLSRRRCCGQTTCTATDAELFTVESKSRRRRCGNVEIRRFVPDFQAAWKSPVWSQGLVHAAPFPQRSASLLENRALAHACPALHLKRECTFPLSRE